MCRGGAWNNPAQNLRAAYRNHDEADDWNDDLGFRVACAPANTLTPVTVQGPTRALASASARTSDHARPFS